MNHVQSWKKGTEMKHLLSMDFCINLKELQDIFLWRPEIPLRKDGILTEQMTLVRFAQNLQTRDSCRKICNHRTFPHQCVLLGFKVTDQHEAVHICEVNETWSKVSKTLDKLSLKSGTHTCISPFLSQYFSKPLFTPVTAASILRPETRFEIKPQFKTFHCISRVDVAVLLKGEPLAQSEIFWCL